jgi:Mycothiol maleylpyruvate isomerase N-terminal domain
MVVTPGAGRRVDRGAEMTSGAVESLQADRDALIGICGSLGQDDWGALSAWAGWSVKGLVSHLAGGFWRVVDPAELVDTTGMTLERAQEAVVASRASWPAARVLDDYVWVSQQAIDRFAGLTDQSAEISFGDLGTHPLSMVANSFGFDHYNHIRSDLCAPRGPLDVVAPPSDALRLVPVLDWICAALPQQNAMRIASATGSLVIEVGAPTIRTIVVGEGPATAWVETDPVSLIRWLGHRSSWDDLAPRARGDRTWLDVARQLQVS